jgi:3-hydroxyisobutyrate dehydrogenase-like beta-hydroxyacid dehydrogenase
MKEHELDVITCLAGRSGRTRELSEKAEISDVATMEDLVRRADAVLAITVSEAVPGLCREVAAAVRATGTDLLYAECNAISPRLSREMDLVLTDSGARYVDASIIGGPPKNGSSPRFYAAGPNVGEFEQLREFGLDVRDLGADIGRASGIKMCYAAMTKGTMALYAELLMAAEGMGLSSELMEEFRHSQPGALQRMEGGLPTIPSKSLRWISEMEQIRDTFDDLGLTPHLFQGVTDMYKLVGDSPLGDETPETQDRERSLADTIRLLSEHRRQPD